MADSRARKTELLERVPLFSCLTRAELDHVIELLTEVRYRKGDVICREGDPGDRLLVILSGEIEARAGDETGRVINRMGPGDFMGEIALFMGGNRTATLTVARAASLLVLDRETFERHLLRNPHVVEHFARVLSQRLAVASREDEVERRSLIVGVRADPGLKGKSLVANALAGFLGEYSRHEVLLLQTSSRAGRRKLRPVAPLLSTWAEAPTDRIKSELQPGAGGVAVLALEIDSDRDADVLGQLFSALIARVGDLFSCVIVDFPDGPGPVVACADEFCDAVVEIVTRAEPSDVPASAHTRVYPVVNLYNLASDAQPVNHCEPFILGADIEIAKRGPAASFSYLRDQRETITSASLRRLARKLLGATVGVAVGGGAAFGIAHVGVLRVFEENDIPVDILTGVSMGSIVALGYAAGIRASQMLDIARDIGNVRTTLSALDFTLTKPGLLAGNRIVSIFGPLLGDVRSFEELVLPCQVVAMDVRSGEQVNIDRGPLDKAFRASSSVPMLWSPVPRGDRVLVDGAMVTPVPAELVTQMGADVSIAINVVPPLREGVETVLSKAYRRLNALNPLTYFGDGQELPNTFDAIMNSIQMLQYELGNFKSISADVRINPDLSEFTWIEFYRAMEIIERGAEAAERALPEIRRVLDERTGLRATA
jgi:NTE family protein